MHIHSSMLLLLYKNPLIIMYLKIGVYHAGAIRLVKCSSIYSQQFESLHYLDHHHHNNNNSNNTSSSSSNNNSSYLKKLSWNVKLGVWFHFAKFYIILMPFYCGVQKVTIPLSIICGVVFGFILMWAVFGTFYI